jgi:biotin carboxyl carrier protein
MTSQRRGRPWSAVRAESAEAAALAGFLRRQIDESGKTLEQLAAEIAWSRSQISSNVGGAIPTAEFVRALIEATVPRDLRERRRSEAVRLLRSAQHPTAVDAKAAPAGSQLDLLAMQTQQVETYDRLTRSLEKQAELEHAANNSAKIVMVLLGVIRDLDRRLVALAEQRDQLRARQGDPAALEKAQAQVERARTQEQRARSELQRAEEKRQQAEELAARVQEQVRQLTEELDQLRAQAQVLGDAEESIAAAPTLANPTLADPNSADAGDPAADDIDQALDRVAAINDEDAGILRRISDELDTETHPAHRSVVPDNPADNPATSGSWPNNVIGTVKLPQQRHPITEGTVTRWLRGVGDPVEANEPLLEVSTSQGGVKVLSPWRGTLGAILVPEGNAVEIGAPLAEIRTRRPVGPWDISEVVNPEEGRVDLGALLVPGVEGMELRVELAGDAIVAATLVVGNSAIQLQAFAAPRSEGIWDEVRKEIAQQISQGGGTVETEQGPLGYELHAQVPVVLPDGTGGVQLVTFIGYDGPRWFLRGVISGQAAVQPKSARRVLEAVFQDTVVLRGDLPMAPRDPLVLTLPEDAQMGKTKEEQEEMARDIPYWFAVPEQRQLKPDGQHPLRPPLLPGTWYLAVTAGPDGLLILGDDGARGWLFNVSGIQRGTETASA